MKSASRKVPKKAGGLDPLFDYSRVQAPICLDDDDDDDTQIVDPTKCSSEHQPQVSSPLNSQKGKLRSQVNQVVKVNSEEDWLEELTPPEPALPRSSVRSADSTLLKIRKQKEELQKIWQASEESVRNIEEAVRLEARATHALSQPDLGNAVSKTCNSAPHKRQKILLKLQGENEESHSVRIFVDDKFEKLFSHYAGNVGKCPVTDFVFRFDGQQISPNGCPQDLDLEDEDIIEVFAKAARR